MRTRTLLLLAIGCGLIILVAGVVQLLRLGGQEQSAQLLNVGQQGKAGDVTVSLLSTTAHDTELVAVVRIGGADDADGLNGFTLAAPGKVVHVSSTPCVGITVETADCSLTFSTLDMQGVSRQLFFDRADVKLRWVLAAGD